ncbi:MAG: NAD(P)/FAD-dependent oxidoreductase [Gammaproteobacteria bacterium]|jgi:thioredoxin reductase (NADPH)|nr:NAD(P)/FAD-dependent oxidoreductase [Gammaproteobacteria bacterium]
MENSAPVQTDVVIVGAGPSGLFQIFELGLLGIRAHVIDSLPTLGGQCSMLYPEKPIYDIPALPVCSAQELIDRLLQQCQPFAPEFHLGQEVVELRQDGEDGFFLRTSKGTALACRAVVIAAGLGAFQARPLRVPGAKRHEGVNLHYRVTDRERLRGRRLVILGGGDSALDWTLDLAEIAGHVTLVHRRDAFRAAPASVARMKALAAESPERLAWRVGQVKGLVEEEERLVGLKVETAPGEAEVLPLDDLLVFYGLSPDLGPIAEWGLEIEKRQLRVDTEKFETSVPGIFAVGDINTYPGKKKLILSGFHEAALAAFGIQRRLRPDEKQYLQYTTTSPIMHERLGVSGAMPEHRADSP